MPRKLNILFQIVLLGCQLVNQYFDVVTIQAEHKLLVTLILGFIQGAIAIVAHSYNPDGARAEFPYANPKVIGKIAAGKR